MATITLTVPDNGYEDYNPGHGLETMKAEAKWIKSRFGITARHQHAATRRSVRITVTGSQENVDRFVKQYA